VPFDFLKRKKAPDPAPIVAPGDKREGVAFDGLTEDWRLIGKMMIEGRLSDALNKREPIDIVDVEWGPIDGSEPMVAAPGLKNVDPYDLVIVVAGEDSLPDLTAEGREAHRIHKVSYEIALEVPPYRVIGTVYLHPGSEPASLLSRSSDMFVPIVEATAMMGDTRVGPETATAVLVNRQYIRGVQQVDVRTGEPHAKLPGASMGGVNWTDRSR
jgi:hypothetical protein